MPIYRFLCEDGHVHEDIVPMGTESVPCPHVVKEIIHVGSDVEIPCGKPAKHVPQTSMGRPQGGPTPIHYPGRGTR